MWSVVLGYCPLFSVDTTVVYPQFHYPHCLTAFPTLLEAHCGRIKFFVCFLSSLCVGGARVM